MSTPSSTFSDAIWPAASSNMIVRNVVLAVAGSALITVCAKIQVPMWPVPMTMQLFAVLLVGLAYGSRLGFATVGLYLAQGAVGLPVFAAGGGLPYLMGPTGGFLFGFAAAAFAAGWLAEHGWGRPALRIFLAAVVGIALVYAIGVPWLANFYATAKGLAVDVALTKAVANGMTPFLIGDSVKAVLAAVILPTAWKWLGERKA